MQQPEWFYSFAGIRRGPVTEDQIRKLVVEKTLDIDSALVWRNGMAEWLSLADVAEFEPSVELIKRLALAENQPADIEILRAILEETNGSDRSLLERIPLFWLTIRITLGGVVAAYLWAWISETVDGGIYIPAVIIPLVNLIIAGHHSYRVSLSMRLLAGAISFFSYCLSLYLAYLTQHGAVVGESLLSSSKINWPSAYFVHLFQLLENLDMLVIAMVFLVPFFLVGNFYVLMARLSWHENYVTSD